MPWALAMTRSPKVMGSNLIQPLLTIPDVARLSGFSEKTVRRWIADGRLIARKLGSQWRIHPSDYATLLHEATSQWRQ